MEASEYSNILEKLDELSQDFHALQAEMRVMFHGDPSGDSNRPGLIVRVDRLEQTATNNKLWIKGILLVLGGLLTEVIHRMLK